MRIGFNKGHFNEGCVMFFILVSKGNSEAQKPIANAKDVNSNALVITTCSTFYFYGKLLKLPKNLSLCVKLSFLHQSQPIFLHFLNNCTVWLNANSNLLYKL